MHFQFQIKHYAAQTDSEIPNLKQKIDRRQASWRHIIQGEERKQKQERKGGISCSPERPDAAQNIHVLKKMHLQDSLNYSQQQTSFTYFFFFIILLSQACQLVFVPQRGIKLLISPSLGELSCYPMKLKTVLSDRDFRSSDWHQSDSGWRRLTSSGSLKRNQSSGDTVGGNDWSALHILL